MIYDIVETGDGTSILWGAYRGGPHRMLAGDPETIKVIKLTVNGDAVTKTAFYYGPGMTLDRGPHVYHYSEVATAMLGEPDGWKRLIG